MIPHTGSSGSRGILTLTYMSELSTSSFLGLFPVDPDHTILTQSRRGLIQQTTRYPHYNPYVSMAVGA